MGEILGGGETIRRQEFEKKVNYVAVKLTNAGIFNPTPEQQNKMPQRMEEVFNYLGHGAKKVSDLKDNIALLEDKEILGQAAFKVVQELAEKDPRWNNALIRGSDYMNNLIVVPELKGLGHRITKNVVSDVDIDASLNRLNVFRLKLNTDSAKDASEYLSRVEAKIESIKTSFTDGEKKDQIKLVLGGLKNEGMLVENREINIKVVEVTKKLKEAGIINPNKEQKDVMAQKMKEVFECLGHGTKSVREIEYTINSSSATEKQKNNAEKDKKILSRAVSSATRELGRINPSLKNDLFMGSKHVDNMLTDELKGLGREISRNYVSNQKIDDQLNLLEVTRKNIDYQNLDSVRTFSEKINKTRNNIIEMSFENENDVLEQDEVSTVLNSEQRKLTPKVEEPTEATQRQQKNGTNSNTNGRKERAYTTHPQWISNVDENGEVVFAPPESQPISSAEGDTSTPINGRRPDRLSNLDSPKKEDFIRNLMFGLDPALDNRNYPSWVKEMSPSKQYLMHVMSELAKFSSLKASAPFDRLLEARPSLLKEELILVYECPGVRFALQKIVNELFTLEPEKDENGAKFLHLKSDPKVDENIYNLGKYEEEIVKEVLKNKIDGISNEDDAKMAVATAVNFLITSDVVESADDKKRLKPTRARVDKMNAMYHPFAKFCGKLGITKDNYNGKQEFDFGGKVSFWAYRRMEADVKFKAKVKRSFETDDREYRIFPKRMAASFIDMYEVEIEKTGRKVSMAEALIKGEKIRFIGDNLNVMSEYKDMFEGVYKSFLLMTDKGDRLKVSNPQTALAEALALVRQVSIPGTNKQELGFTNDPDFFAFTFGNWYGLNDSEDLTLKFENEFYIQDLNRILNIDRLIENDLIRNKIREKLHGNKGLGEMLLRRKNEEQNSKSEERRRKK